MKRILLALGLCLLFVSCSQDPTTIEGNLPSIEYVRLSDITFYSAVVFGKIDNPQKQNLLYNVNIEGDVNITKLFETDENGYFSVPINGLAPTTLYSVTIDITSFNDIISSDSITFKTKEEYILFEDTVLESYCLSKYNTNNDLYIDLHEAENVTEISINSNKLVSLKGIEYFNNLTYLDLSFCNISGTVDLTKNTKLDYVDLSDNPKVENILFGYSPSLVSLFIVNTDTGAIDLSNIPNLRFLDYGYHYWLSMNHDYTNFMEQLKNIPDLEWLGLHGFGMDSIDFRSNPKLNNFYFNTSWFNTIDLSYSPDIFSLSIGTSIEKLIVRRNQIVPNYYPEKNLEEWLDVGEIIIVD